MAVTTYKKLALRWQPSHREDKVFTLLAVVCVVVLLLVGLYLSSIDVPKKMRSERAAVPERVAKFIAQQERPEPESRPEPPKPKPKPKPPEPKEEPDKQPDPVKVTRERPEEKDEPLTDEQRKARDVAKQSGLMAHVSELQDLMDTADVGAQVKSSIKEGQTKAAGHSADVLVTGARQDSGGVNADRYRTDAGNARLGETDLAATRAVLSSREEVLGAEEEKSDTQDRLRSRSEEEISLVFDRHKSQLQRLYNRARRQNPALKGKLVLELTILPDGTVAKVTVLSSELTDPSLVQRMLARIKTFQFGARDVAVATVSYPIEFLPY